MTVVCLGLHGLSDLAERGALSEREAIRLVDEFIEEIQEHVVFAGQRRGAADRFFGCRMLVYCGVPVAKDDREEAEMAVDIALDSMHRFEALREDWIRRFGPDGRKLWLGIAIHTGPVVVGAIHNRIGEKEYTILGRTPHVAEQLEFLLTRIDVPSKILVSGATAALIGEKYHLALVDCKFASQVLIDGEHQAIEVYALLGQKVRHRVVEIT